MSFQFFALVAYKIPRNRYISVVHLTILYLTYFVCFSLSRSVNPEADYPAICYIGMIYDCFFFLNYYSNCY